MATVDVDSEFESLISELHSLKKLYGLLQKKSPADQLLDEKSRLLLKKLLDDAAQQVLQSRVKIISCSIEIPTLQAASPPMADSCSLQVGLLKPVDEPGVSSSSRRLQVAPDRRSLLSCRRGESVVNRPSMSESRKKSFKPSKFPSDRCPPTRSSGSENGTADSYSPQVGLLKPVDDPGVSSSSKRFQVVPDCRPLQCRRRGESVVTHPSQLESRKKSSKPSKVPSERCPPTRSSGSEKCVKRTSSLVPAEKRARVGAQDCPNRVRSGARGPDRLDRELTHRKRTSRSSPPCPSRIKPSPRQRTQSKDDRGSKSVVVFGESLTDKKPSRPEPHPLEICWPKKPQPDRLKTRRHSSSFSDSSRFSSGSRSSTTASSAAAKSDLAPPIRRNRSTIATAPPRIENGRAIRKTEAAKPQSRQRKATKASKSVSRKGEEKPGKLMRFKNKLAIIFHHHHHLHGVTEDVDGGGHRKDEESAIWRYVKAAVHLGGGGGKQAGKEAKTSKRRQRQHGYLYAMVEGLLRHIWGLRPRRVAQMERRRLGKKAAKQRGSIRLRWWQWFRRRNGRLAGVGNRRRLRLGFGKSTSRRCTKVKH